MREIELDLWGYRLRVMAGLVCCALGAAGRLAAGEPLNEIVTRAYDHFYNLEYPEAIADFERAVALQPDNAKLRNHLAEAILFQEMYRDGALESELVTGTNSFLRRPKLNPTAETEHRFLDEVGKSMSLCEARLKRNPDDTKALYDMGISYGLRSNYYWVVKKSWRDSLRDATAARKSHNRVSELEPQNVDARLVQGLHDYIVGSLPWGYRMLGALVGVHGDKARGLHTIEEVAHDGSRDRVDASIFLCALYRRENQPGRSVPLVEELIRKYPRNFLFRFELSQMCSQAGDKTCALRAVDEIVQMKLHHAPGYDRVPWAKIYYQRGSIEFWYNDLDQALENLSRVTAARDEVDLNTGLYAQLRVAQIYDLTHRRNEAMTEYRKAIAFAPQSEVADESRKYLSTPYRR
jgi:tetratricopeptide (TPR) repeat protein